MMNMNGIKIFPAEIERVLEEHPGVKAAVAFARASRAHGDIPVAGVELHGTATGRSRGVGCVCPRAPWRACAAENIRAGIAAAQRGGKDREAGIGAARRAVQVTPRPMEISQPRQAIFDALKIAAPDTFNEAMRRAFLADGLNVQLAELALDSLGEMEFCIAIELSTEVTLLPAQLAELGSTDAIEQRVRELLGEPANRQ